MNERKLMLLKNLDRKIKAPNNKTDLSSIPTYKDIIVDSLKFIKTSNGRDSILFNRLADKIYDSLEEIRIEKDEFLNLKESVNINSAGYLAWAHAQVMEYLIDCELNHV